MRIVVSAMLIFLFIAMLVYIAYLQGQVTQIDQQQGALGATKTAFTISLRTIQFEGTTAAATLYATYGVTPPQ